MKINIEGLTEAELSELNHKVVERLRFLQQTRAHERMLDFAIGDRVTFTADGRAPNVAPGFLSKASPKSDTPTASNVITLKSK